ncbi:hypothetical protein [Blastomonas sp.]|uniref:hypothetical protein n=1 Tax=Blastomonas sp. TaxID=1909299 RepID=UPI00406A88AB
MLERMLLDHAVLRERGESLMALLDRSEMPDQQLLAETRWQLSGHVMQHLALKDRYLYAKLLNDPRPHVRAIGEEFHQELAALYADYCEQGKYWTQERVAAEWEAYRHPAKARILAMFARVEREETQLFPLVYDASIDISTQVPHSSNWAREAFAIKDAMTKASARP